MWPLFVERLKELEALNTIWEQTTFQMMVLLGRRRVGKTALLDEFSKDKNTLYFTARQQTIRPYSPRICFFLESNSSWVRIPASSSSLSFLTASSCSLTDIDGTVAVGVGCRTAADCSATAA